MSTLHLPDMPGMDRADVDGFATDLCGAAGFPVELDEQRGRYVHLRIRGVLDEDAAEDVRGVLGNWATHDSFLRDSNVCAWLLTSAQLAAREEAERDSAGDRALLNARCAHSVFRSSDALAVAVRGKRARVPDKMTGLPGQLVALLRELSPDGSIPRAEFIDAAVMRITEQPDARGKDRRRDRVRESLAACIKKQVICERPGECIALGTS